MVARGRLTSFVLISGCYLVAAASVGFFVWQAQHGERGLETRKSLRAELHRVHDELRALRDERTVWERRVAQLQSESIDRDLLEERSRRIVNRVHRDEIVVFDASGDDD
jgi:cell division protein FtsB